MGNDIFIGGIKIVPNFDEMGSEDQWYSFVGGSGKIQIGMTYRPTYGQSLTIDDFELITVIGKGSFGKVKLLFYNRIVRVKAIFLGDASQEAGYFPDLCPQDYQKTAHSQPERNYTHPRRASRSGAGH
jgi:hypothetical protein